MRPTYCRAKRLPLRMVSERRQEEESSKQEDDAKHADLVLCLKALHELKAPESCREALAANMPWLLSVHCDLWERSLRIPFRAVNWIINTYWERLPTERNPKIRCSLFRVGASMLKRAPFTSSELMTGAAAINGMLEVLEQENLPMEELKPGLDLLSRILRKVTDVVYGERLIRMGLRMIERHCTIETLGSSTRAMRRVVCCMVSVLAATPGACPWVSIIIDDAVALNYILGAVRHPAARLHEPLMGLLSLILAYAPPEDRVTLATRHYPRLVQAFHLMLPYQLVAFMEHTEFAGIVATTPSLLRLVYSRARHDCQEQDCDEWEDDYDDYCQIAVLVMESALVADKILQEILGYGFLSVAGHFAAQGIDTDARCAETFRKILDAHPEFCQLFKHLTRNGEAGNLIVEIGRGIPEKKPTKGTWYIWEDRYDEQ